MSVVSCEHGGACCGRYHIWDFSGWRSSTDQWLKEVKQILRDDNINYDNCGYDDELSGMCGEITLTRSQAELECGKGTFQSALEGLGFKEVYRFMNPNSWNEVRVLMYSSNELEIK